MKYIALIALVSTTAACSNDGADALRGDLDAGRMVGDMPTIAGFDDAGTDEYIWLDGDYLDVELHTEGPDGWAMVGGWVRLGEALADGQTYTFSGNQAEGWVGCSGDQMWSPSYDDAPESVTVWVEEIPEIEVEQPEEVPEDFGVEPPADDGSGPVDGGDVDAPTTSPDMMRDGYVPPSTFKITVHADFGRDGVISAATMVRQ